LDRIVRESYNTPERLYRLAKARGMDLVTITDHDSISGALTIADREDVIVGCEITAVFPDGMRCHIGVLGITEAQHREVQKLRHDVRDLMPYLREERIFCTLNHLASQAAGRMSASHVLSLLPWIDAIETRNGSRLPTQNRTALALATAHSKTQSAGSDSHTYGSIGDTYMVCPGARNREEFLAGLRAGRVHVEGREGSFFTLASDIVRLATSFYIDGWIRWTREPLVWKRNLMVIASTAGMPLASLALAGALVHNIQEKRFNHKLLLDLVSQPRDRQNMPPSVELLEPAF
jgi:predicted metal-dependent phosphoesterase TrpH